MQERVGEVGRCRAPLDLDVDQWLLAAGFDRRSTPEAFDAEKCDTALRALPEEVRSSRYIADRKVVVVIEDNLEERMRLACALGRQACLDHNDIHFVTAGDMFARRFHDQDRREYKQRFHEELVKPDLVVVEGLFDNRAPRRRWLSPFEGKVLYDLARQRKRAMVITSSMPYTSWCGAICDAGLSRKIMFGYWKVEDTLVLARTRGVA